MDKFHEGQSVRLREDYPALGLKAGDTGVVWTAYVKDSRSYEVTFCPLTDNAFDMTVTEDEIEAVAPPTPQTVKNVNAARREVEAA